MAYFKEVEVGMETRPLDVDAFEAGWRLYNHVVSQSRYDGRTSEGRSPGVIREMSATETADFDLILKTDFFWAHRFKQTCIFGEFHTVRDLRVLSTVQFCAAVAL